MNIEIFKEELEKLGIKVNQEQEQKLENYYEILYRESQKTNLTTIIKKEDVYLKHFYDSLTVTKTTDFNRELKVCDIGTGAGFPGVVLKIMFPKIKLTLIDSVAKKTEFLKKLVKKLEIEDVIIINDRIENFSNKNPEEYDILISRAVAKANILLEIGIKSLKIKGYYILMKGKDEEISQKALKELNAKILSKEKFNLPIENSERTIIKLQKETKTNNKYPREFTKIKRLPL